MPSSAHLPAIQGVDLVINIVQGRNLVAKDRSKGVFGKKKSSDPYVKVLFGGKKYGKTREISKTLNPEWNETVNIKLGTKQVQKALKGNHKHNMLEFIIFDKDSANNDDPMGTVSFPLTMTDTPPNTTPSWYAVEKGDGEYHCKDASGELLLKVTVAVKKMMTMVRGNSQELPYSTILHVGLGWDLERGRAVDMDTSCVAIDATGNVLINETVYFGDLSNCNGSIKHSGDEQEGDEDKDDEVITVDLNMVPQHVHALFFILTVATPDMTFADIRSASATILNKKTGMGICQVIPSECGQNTALFLMRVSRDPYTMGSWILSIIGDTHPMARDFGSLIPEIKGYSRDIVPNIRIDPHERIAIMRKGGIIRLSDYSASSQLPETITLGLAWDITHGRQIDLDASVICLDHALNMLDIVNFQQLQSRDGAIIHGGDEREGDEAGFDEKIHISLSRVHNAVMYIGLVINSYSGQELDDVAKASCELFDPKTNISIAQYKLTRCKSLDKHTALVMGCIYRDPTTNMWFLRIISEAAHGRVAKELVDELQNFFRRNPPQTPFIPPHPDDISCQMPANVPLPPGGWNSNVTGPQM